MDTTGLSEAETKKPLTTKPKKSMSKLVMVLVVVVLILAAATGAYWYRDKQAKKQQQQLQSEINQLNEQVKTAQKLLDAATATTKTTAQTAAVPSAELIANVKAVFASGNSAALQGYMASGVDVVVAASEGTGTQTAEQATKTITSFMADASDPWNFDLPKTVLAGWASGAYAKYFPANAVVGRSDDMVIAFSFNTSGKISGVLLVKNQDSL